jgi:hypothetical protein
MKARLAKKVLKHASKLELCIGDVLLVQFPPSTESETLQQAQTALSRLLEGTGARVVTTTDDVKFSVVRGS